MARELRQVHLECFVLLHLARTQAAANDIAASARSLREALSLAHARNFQTGRLMGILGAAGLRVRRGDRDAEATARRWCGAVLAVAGSNADVRDAIQALGAAFTDLLEVTRPDMPPTIDAASTEVHEFLDALVEMTKGSVSSCGPNSSTPQQTPGGPH